MLCKFLRKTVWGFVLFLALKTYGATRYVDANSSSPVAPYTNWLTAAATIQDAIDAASPADLVLVTNGVYASGGKVMAGDLTNRVAIDKAITVQSVNGCWATTIVGAKDAATNGPAAIRCAWLTNGAVLKGFTLRNGATRAAGETVTLCSGGGVWASSTNAVVADCLLIENDALYGGGAFRGWLENSIIRWNRAQGDGGGGYSNVFYRCLIANNYARINGGGAYGGFGKSSAYHFNSASVGGGVYGAGALVNCTIAYNNANSIGGTFSSGSGLAVTNCIIWGNQPQNYSGAQFRNSCSTPLPSGVGNISSDPLLLDGVHLASNSPCRSVGLAIATGTDFDGQTWNGTPAIGCDEWKLDPAVSLLKLNFDSWGMARISAFGLGQAGFGYRWMKDSVPFAGDGGNVSGTATTNLIIKPITPNDVGNYQLVVSNALGVVTSQVSPLTIRFVDINSPMSIAPYTNWNMAGSNLQQVVDEARWGDVVMVGGGIYGSGGKVVSGDLTNRVVINKPVTLLSRDGPSATIIQGAWDYSTTNGPGAVRCVWLGEGAALIGFNVRGGAVRGLVGDGVNLQSGSGIWCASTNVRIANCVIEGCASASGGGSVFRGTLVNCLIRKNIGFGAGVGTVSSSLVNCSVVENRGVVSIGSGIGVFAQSTNQILNSILWGNYSLSPTSPSPDYSGGVYTNCCTRPLPPGAGNIASDPLFESDGFHLRSDSPCLGAGNTAFVSGRDLEGQQWSSPPAMGCDQRMDQLALGQPQIVPTGDGKIRLQVSPVGANPVNYWWLKDGNPVANDGRVSGAQSAELAVGSFGPADAGYYHVVASNLFGSVTSAVVQVRVRFVDAGNPTPGLPYTNWTMAATSIQSAVDAAGFGDLIVVADGIYDTGGAAVAADFTNRIALGKVVRVSSLNGATNAIIVGQKDSLSPSGNGSGAVRPVWMENWTSLAGFTIRDGATRTNGDVTVLQSGGGVWAQVNATVLGCVITNNSANQNGGGVFGGSYENCRLVGNTATNGGGMYAGSANRCFLTQNRALSVAIANGGGGASGSSLRNSVIHRNFAYNTGNIAANNGGAASCNLYSCTVTENDGNGLFFGVAYNTISWGNTFRDYSGSISMNYSCARFAIASYGTNNLYSDPQLVDPFHLSVSSPCRAAGGPLFVSGTDFDGEAWASPVSIGADEFYDSNITGPLSVAIELPSQPVFPNRLVPLIGRVTGRATRIEWSFGDGPLVTNASYATQHLWSNPGDYQINFTAYNSSFPLGVSTSAMLHVTALPAPQWTAMENLGGYYRFTVNTQPGVTNHIEYTTNLAAPVLWMPLKTSVATNVVMREYDFSPTDAARFYRIRSE